MTKRSLRAAVVVIAASAAMVGWLAWSSNGGGAEQPGQSSFRNPIEQREQMIHELQEIKELIRQQNGLLEKMQKNGT